MRVLAFFLLSAILGAQPRNVTGRMSVRVVGVTGMVNKTGSPTGSIRYRLYEGTGSSRTLVATTVSSANISTTVNHSPLWFDSTILMKANTWYTVVLSETTQSDASTNRYNLLSYSIRSAFEPLLRGMLGAATKYSSTTDGGSTWSADTDNEYPHLTFFLDTSQGFVIPSGGFATVQ